MSLADGIGVIGVLLYLVTYFLLQIEKFRFDDYSYLALNALAAILIIVSLIEQFNFPAFLIEAAWALISLMGIVRRRKNGRSTNTQSAGDCVSAREDEMSVNDSSSISRP